MGNIDLTHSDLLISAGSKPGPISVSLRNGCGSINGTVRSAGSNAQVAVLLVPDSAVGQPSVSFFNGPSFALSGLSPGSYRVYAFSDLQGVEYANPEALDGYAGQQITLGANERAAVTLDLLTRRSN
jgi:hypothetical protein